MAPGRILKRPRAPTEDVDSVIGEVGNGQKGRGKRPRYSHAEESDNDLYSGEASHHSGSESESVVEDNRENDDDELYVQQTQRVERQLRNNGNVPNIPAESGIIEEIRCTNFMCHEQLTVPLGPLINFIIGHNGSGKSAVLTALTLCLGGKAAATNRGQNLKSFIKEGKDFCVLSVKIKNQGTAAYRPDRFGRSIIIERHFNKSGTSGFKLKDANGKAVSTKKQELEDIIDAFALQIDNPINVLTQDMARQFLNDSSANLKYKFFLKGTQLETLQHDYNLIKSELEGMESKSATVLEDANFLLKKYQEAKSRALRAANLEKMRERETLLAHQSAWARVEEEEQELRETEDQIENVNKIIEERQMEADKQSEKFAIEDHAWSQASEKLQERQAEKEPLDQEIADIKAQWKEIQGDLLKAKGTQRDAASKMKNKSKTIERYESQIREHRQRQAEADDGQHAQKVRELEEAKNQLAKLQESLANHDNGLESLNQDLRSAQRRKQTIDGQVEEKRTTFQRTQTKINELERGGQRNWMASYPQPASLQKLLDAIQAEQRFREQPIGPMGRYVKLMKPEWSSILERSCGSSLNAFVVTSKSDQTLLSNIMRRINSSFPIYIGQNNQIDTSRHEPDPELDTWLRVLTISNNLVRNQMIINHNIDQVALIPDRKTAEEFMHRGGPPRNNVKVCFTMADSDPTKGHAISLNQHSGAIGIGPIYAWVGSARMQADKEPQIRAERSNLQRFNEELNYAKLEASQLQSQVDENRAKLKQHERRKTALNRQLERAQADMDRLEDELNTAPDAGAIEHLEGLLKEAQKEKEFEEGQFQDIVLYIDKLNVESHTHKASLEEAQQRLAQFHVELGKASARADKLKSKRDEALRCKNEALEAVDAAQENRGIWEQKRGEQIAEVESIASEAGQICARVVVPEGETYESLNRKRERLRQERERSEKELGGSQETLQDEAHAARGRYQEARKEIDEITNVTKKLKLSLESRQRRWAEFRKWISAQARITFGYLLSERKFRGELKLDHKTQQLDIHVQPDITVASGAGRQTKTLSGGEKSFSTICLLLSLWDAMGSPIRCLDEFDVFMDNVNRDISMKMMIGAARRSVGRQFILITPQAMSNVHSAGDVKIIRMSDPERGQTTINIGG